MEVLPRTMVLPRRSNSTNNVDRFSLLLLEFGEIYFEDFSVIFYPNASTMEESVESRQRGRLKVCSKSVLFDALDCAYPIIKIAYRDCTKIERWQRGASSRIGDNSLLIEAHHVTEMLEGNAIAPFSMIKVKRRFLFSLTYGTSDSVLSQILTLHRATKLPTVDQNSLIGSIVMARRSEVCFNRSWLEDLYEETVCEMSGEKVTPLVSNPGRIMLTSLRIYFQPFNNVEVEPVVKLKLSELKHVMKRRYMLRHVGVELFCRGGRTLFLALPSRSERNALVDRLLVQPSLLLETLSLEEATRQWQAWDLSNYDYLMLLNFLADRSFNDIMQYPVMPWVIADYTSQELDLCNPATFRDLSKPIGALNDERLAFYKERYQEMHGRQFLYGTHYSAPGYVLYFLVRSAPEYLLCLQNGRFDQPNRLFHSIAKTWLNVNTDHADVKELIPEFYQPPGDFLLNTLNLDLGVRTDDVRVNNVCVPPWAKDAEEFTLKCRAALESDHVSQHLHKWIDLIFGSKQLGEEAVMADNVFHYLTYEGSISLDTIHDPAEQAAAELQIKEFGQTPKQIFTRQHPKRVIRAQFPDAVPLPVVQTTGVTTEGLGTVGSGGVALTNSMGLSLGGVAPGDDDAFAETPPTSMSEWVVIELPSSAGAGKVPLVAAGAAAVSRQPCLASLRLDLLQKMHKEPVSAVKLSHDGKTLFSASHDKTLKVHLLEDKQLLRSASISNLPLSCLAVLPDSKTVLVGSWDNNVHTYSVEYASVVSSAYCHHSSITSLCWREGMLATGSWDSTVKVWDLSFNPQTRKSEAPDMKCELDHDNEVSCVDLDPSLARVASGTVDGFLSVWSIADESREYEIQAHGEAIHAVAFSPDGMRVCTCGGDGYVRILDPVAQCEIIARKASFPFHCMVWTSSGDHILLGSESGELHVWESHTLKDVARVKGHSAPIISMDLSSSGWVVVTGARDRCVGVWHFS